MCFRGIFMKKLLFAAVVIFTIVSFYELNAMGFKKNEKNQLVAVVDSPDYSLITYPNTLLLQKPLDRLGDLEGEDRKKAIQQWCNDFKGDSKKKEMWISSYPEKLSAKQDKINNLSGDTKTLFEQIKAMTFQMREAFSSIDWQKNEDKKLAMINELTQEEQGIFQTLKNAEKDADKRKFLYSLVLNKEEEAKLALWPKERVIEEQQKIIAEKEFEKKQKEARINAYPINFRTLSKNTLKQTPQESALLTKNPLMVKVQDKVQSEIINGERETKTKENLLLNSRLKQLAEESETYKDKYGIYSNSPHCKKWKESGHTHIAHDIENHSFHESLDSLKIAKEVHEHKMSNMSIWSWLWNYIRNGGAGGGYFAIVQGAQDTLQHLNDEIASFTEKNNRDAFARSCLHKSAYDYVKENRE
jgi:hypothetical protein